MAGRTTLIVAHRLSTIEHADIVVVLDHGKLVESGSHAQLFTPRSRLLRAPARTAIRDHLTMPSSACRR